MTLLTMPGLPGELQWKNQPADWRLLGEDGLAITAGAESDWFIDPVRGEGRLNAAAALFAPPDPDFCLRARVRVDFGATYDAGVLCIYADDSYFAKLCFEYSPQGQPMIVSVVTRGVSDDSNALVVAGNTVYLRLLRRSGAWAFHYSLDGAYWHLVRYFALGGPAEAQVGFLAQSPTGQGCRVEFSGVVYAAGRIEDLRNGE